MCGFIGAFATSHQVLGEGEQRRALDRLRRRGPDDEGTWFGEGAFLGHRRLAIMDLDRRATQPMHSNCGRYVVVFNGEIFNFRDLRRDLETRGTVFRTTSDTEVILALFAADGEAMLPKLHGMFALMIWDRVDRKAFIARDPYGIKPLYVWESRGEVMVASQVKALLATGKVSRDPDALGQAGFWMLGSVPEPRTWFRDIRSLPAGHCAWIASGRVESSRCWHDIGDAWRAASHPGDSNANVQEQVRSVLQESVRRHLVADVPVGVFLSGGIDSGAIAGLMLEAGARNLEGVTIAYDEYKGWHEDEAPMAAELAAHYGIRHTVRRVTHDEFVVDLPRILDAMDQPSIDGVNTWYASKAAAELGMKVVVSGVGGDELFQGYSTFRELPRLFQLRRLLGRVPSADAILSLAGRAQARRSGNRRWNHLGQWSRTIEGLWWLRRSVYAPEDLSSRMDPILAQEALAGFEATSWLRRMVGQVPPDPKLALGQIESMAYLRNQLLRDSDWASMDHGVELRTPLVDATLLHGLRPVLSQFEKYQNKTLLSQSLLKPLPQAISSRRKTGFGIPVERWLNDISPVVSKETRFAWAAHVADAYGTTV